MNGSEIRRSKLSTVRDSFWFVPAAFAVGAVAAAIGLSVLELRLVIPVRGVLPSGPDGARSLLSAIITAMISFTALVFSITVVALQLASSQYSPRVLRTFLQDRVIQVALGTFVATFLFAMIVLAALPAEPSQRLPELSLALSMALVLCSSGVFIYYLHHITTTMRVSHIIASIGAQTRRMIITNYPDEEPDGSPVALGPVEQVITAPRPGMVNEVTLDALARLARRHDCAISVLRVPGDFVTSGTPFLLVHRHGDAAPTPVDPADALRQVSVGVERIPGQDVAFGFRQLADIAERALSPGLNDLTTAIRALQETHDLLRLLVTRPCQPWLVRDEDGSVRARAERPGLDTVLAVSVDDVRHAGAGQPRVLGYLDLMLRDVSEVARPEHRLAIGRRLAEPAGGDED